MAIMFIIIQNYITIDHEIDLDQMKSVKNVGHKDYVEDVLYIDFSIIK